MKLLHPQIENYTAQIQRITGITSRTRTIEFCIKQCYDAMVRASQELLDGQKATRECSRKDSEFHS